MVWLQKESCRLSTIWLNRFHLRIGLKILNAVTSSADIFLSLKWKIISRPLLWLHIIDLGNDRQSDDIHGKPRKNGFPWSCSDKSCIHNISGTKSIANQSLLIRAILSRQATRSSGAWQDKRLHGPGNAVADIRKGREGMFLVREKPLRVREKEGRGTLSSPPFSLALGLVFKFPSLPFWTPATRARDNQVIL